MPSGKPGTRKPKPPDLRTSPAQGKPLDGSKNPGGHPKVWTESVLNSLADEMEAFYEENPDAMLLEDFCAHKRFGLGNMSIFAKENEKFAQSKKIIECIITSRIFKAAGSGKMHATIGVFGLKNSGTKWTDKQEVAHSGEIAQTHRYEMPNPRPIE